MYFYLYTMYKNGFLFFIFLLFCLNTCKAKSYKIKVITFNIRGDYKDGKNQWKNRKAQMIDFLSKESSEILCMQEVHYNQLMDLDEGLQLYESEGVGRTDGKKKGDFTPIFFSKEKFIKIDGGTFWLSETPDSIGSIGWDAKSPRIATWVNLKHIKSGEIIFVINTHLDHIGKKARERSATLIMDTLPSLAKSNRIIFTGDFNDVESSKVYKIVSERNLHDSYVLKSTQKGCNYTFHQYGMLEKEKRNKIDYIFVNENFKIVDVIIPIEMPKNEVYLSDHNPIISTLKFK